MVTFPNAKINLGLFITHKRSDGYHSIESIFYPIKITDALEMGKFDPKLPLLQISGIEIEGDSDDNLVVKAIRIIENFLKEKKKTVELEKLQQFRFILLKNIPTGAGLGGGSADGTFALKMLNEKLDLNLDPPTLENMALQLGSDCPFFVQNTPALVKGRGEILEPFDLNLAGYHLVLIHPGIHISTKEAYAGVQPKPVDFNWKKIQTSNLSLWKNHLQNDFEKTVFLSHPEIEKVKNELYEKGAVYAQMSGSGSAVFGIFEKGKDLNFLSEFLSRKNYSAFTCEL